LRAFFFLAAFFFLPFFALAFAFIAFAFGQPHPQLQACTSCCQIGLSVLVRHRNTKPAPAPPLFLSLSFTSALSVRLMFVMYLSFPQSTRVDEPSCSAVTGREPLFFGLRSRHGCDKQVEEHWPGSAISSAAQAWSATARRPRASVAAIRPCVGRERGAFA